MSGREGQARRERPLVAVVSSVPLVAEAVRSALDFAEVVCFADRGGDLAGLLQWLRPDVLVVDSEAARDGAEAFAQANRLPVLQISVRDHTLRLFSEGAWRAVGSGEEATPEAVRNVVAGALYARAGVAAT